MRFDAARREVGPFDRLRVNSTGGGGKVNVQKPRLARLASLTGLAMFCAHSDGQSL